MRESGGAEESPPSHQNTRRRVDGWQKASISRFNMREGGGAGESPLSH